jgi:hypothetical protein
MWPYLDSLVILSKRKITDSNLKEHGFTILEAKHGVIVLNINHKGGESNSGNIYISDY